MVLTTIAGLAGVSFAVLVLQAVEIVANAEATNPIVFQISFWTAIGATFLLLTLGMLAGLAPAFRAMAIKPIEAIRDE
jgi:putative ABC transport system permease protein